MYLVMEWISHQKSKFVRNLVVDIIVIIWTSSQFLLHHNHRSPFCQRCSMFQSSVHYLICFEESRNKLWYYWTEKIFWWWSWSVIKKRKNDDQSDKRWSEDVILTTTSLIPLMYVCVSVNEYKVVYKNESQDQLRF